MTGIPSEWRAPLFGAGLGAYVVDAEERRR
jgi:hypothetical protein